MGKYDGKVVIVTGAASGIGLGITEFFIAEGAKVVIADVNAESGAKVIAGLNASLPEARAAFFKTDVTSWASLCALFEYSYATFGPRIDAVFANAGIAQMREMKSSDPTHFGSRQLPSLAGIEKTPPSLAVIDVNLTGALLTTSLALSYFRAQEKDEAGWRGKLVITGSNASFYPFPNDTLYAAAKAGVLGTVRSLGPKVFKEGITVNAFGPSVVPTGLAPKAFLDRLDAEGRLTPMTTIQACADMLIDPKSKLSGQLVENCGTRNALRAIPQYMDDVARKNMNEFHDADEIDLVLNQAGYDVV